MVWELLIGFLVLVAASYVGTTMALRGFFGRDYYAPPSDAPSDDSPPSDAPSSDAPPPELYSETDEIDGE